MIPRRLWYETKDGRVFLSQADLIGRPESMVVLGDAGMGKTRLLKWLSKQAGYPYHTARQIKYAHLPGMLGNASKIVVDALDELTAQGEGDAVDVVLQKLREAGYPQFVIACRVADWRNATGVSAIREQYGDVDLLVLHLEPLTNDQIVHHLTSVFGGDSERASGIASYFDDRQLHGLLGNPQTLELVARVANTGALPKTKAELFARAVDLLRKEHRDVKVELQPDEASALDAAGAAFAALILTGGDALVVENAEVSAGDVLVAEVAALPGAQKLKSVLGSRLFAGSANRFKYSHRRVGEFVGSRWLSQQADTAIKRKRLMALFRSEGLVPASLRGLHAWLAYHDKLLAPEVIEADPMGVIEYGDADSLDEHAARGLLKALQALAARNPHFRDWKSYSLKSIAQLALLPGVRALIIDPDTEFELRLLLIEALKDSPIAATLASELREILLESSAAYPLRSAAFSCLVGHEGEDWLAVVQGLLAAAGDNDVRLGLEIVERIGLAPFDDALVVQLVLAQARHAEHGFHVSVHLERAVPDARLGSILDELAAQVVGLGNRDDRPGNNDITDFGYRLIARRLALGAVEPIRFWSWLRPFEAEAGFSRDIRAQVHRLIRENDQLRRAVQRFVLLEESGPKTVWERAWRLTRRSSGLDPTPGDVIELLRALAPAESDGERWRDLLRLTPHSETEGAEVRQMAKQLVAKRPDMTSWIDKLAERRVPDWEIKQQEKEKQRNAKRAMEWKQSREAFAKDVEGLRDGKFAAIIRPAMGYVGLYRDLNDELAPQDRIVEWLGDDLATAAFEGFEAFLQSNQPPSAEQVAHSYADSRMWHGTYIVVAALAERLRRGAGFSGVSDDRLTTGFYELLRSRIDDQAKLEGLEKAIETEMKARGLVKPAMRRWIEPQLERRLRYVDQLYALMRSKDEPQHAVSLAVEWLRRFPDMSAETEAEMIDRLVASHEFEVLRSLAATRLPSPLPQDRTRIWDSVAFLTDFDAQRERLSSVAANDPDWLWAVRQRTSGDRGRSLSASLSVEQLAWLLRTFRGAFPFVGHPTGLTSGDTNPWNATEFLASVAGRLADMTSDTARAAMIALRDTTPDSYSNYLRRLSAEQQQKYAEGRYQPPSLGDLRAIVEAGPPRTASDLQATLLANLERVQNRIVADPIDSWRGFFTDQGEPHAEDRCRDHLLLLLGERPESIDLAPEGHLADDKRADIVATYGPVRVPIEIKGQWHKDLWHAADTQLDRLYATDYAAERRGIYLVLWFGSNVKESKRPAAPSAGLARPTNPEELRQELVAASSAARDGRVAVFVLDLVRPPR